MNPWEQTWNDVKQGVEDIPSSASSSVKEALPWLKDWSNRETSPKPQQAAVAPSRPTVEDIMPKLIQAESLGKHTDEEGKLITSKRGAEGITQLMPTTALKPGYGITPVKDKSESEYMRVGKEYLQKMYDKFGDWEKALAAYNYGVGNVMKAIGKAERFGEDWRESLPKETKDYIQKIMGGLKSAALSGAEAYAGANKPVDISTMAGSTLGDKLLEETGSPALASAADVGSQLALDPTNLVPGLKGLAMVGAVFKTGDRILSKDGKMGVITSVREQVSSKNQEAWRKKLDELSKQAFNGYMAGQHTFEQATEIYDELLKRNDKLLRALWKNPTDKEIIQIPKVLFEGETRPKSVFNSEIEKHFSGPSNIVKEK